MVTSSPSSASPPIALEKLPPNIPEDICELLASCDRKRRSLFAFSLVSWRCYEAFTRHRFERIRLVAWGGEDLREKLGRWKDSLARHGGAPYVRQLKVAGSMQGSRPEAGVLQGITMDHLSYSGEADGDTLEARALYGARRPLGKASSHPESIPRQSHQYQRGVFGPCASLVFR